TRFPRDWSSDVCSSDLLAAEAVGSALRMAQTLEWRGPSEWGAPEGRVLAHERRTILVRPGERAHVIDILSDWQPTDWDMSVGPRSEESRVGNERRSRVG